MVLVELNNAFDLEYQSASNVAPDINMYEKSYFFTKSVNKLIREAIPLFDKNESSKRLLQPLLIQNFACSIVKVDSEFSKFEKYKVTYPNDFRLLLRISITSKKCGELILSKEDKIDFLNETMSNPFRKPNKRKVIKVLGETDNDKHDYIYTSKGVDISKVNISYLKHNNPIILMDLRDDPTTIGDETIDGKYLPTMTELSKEFYPSIISTAVIFAIESLRTNTLNTKLNIQ